MLPEPYARWLQAALGRALPEETRATCASCAMCGGAGEPDAPTLLISQRPLPGEREFHPDSKCCTFFPYLPSFRVGAILLDGSPEAAEGRNRVAMRIAMGLGVTPVGLSPSPRYVRRYRESTGAQGFGRDQSLVCPYYDEGNCTIWRHREAACATFFCRHEHGVRGARAWTTVARLLEIVERSLILHCALTLGLDAAVLDELYNPDGTLRVLAHHELGGPVDDDGGRLWPALARRVWGRWANDEGEYYQSCARLVGEMDWRQVQLAGGAVLAQGVARTKAALAALSAPVGDKLSLGLVNLHRLADGRVSLAAAETIYDPVRVPESVATMLPDLDGVTPVTGLAPDLVAALARQGVLVEPDARHLPPEPLGAQTPLEPTEWLCVYRGYGRAEMTASSAMDPEGKPVMLLRVGSQQMTLDEPALLPFGSHLLEHQHGFCAGHAVRWSGNEDKPYPWDSTKELLESLLAARILVRLGEP